MVLVTNQLDAWTYYPVALARLVRATELVDSNVSPELVLDVVILRWPRIRAAA